MKSCQLCVGISEQHAEVAPHQFLDLATDREEQDLRGRGSNGTLGHWISYRCRECGSILKRDIDDSNENKDRIWWLFS
ncbi:MAG: hypothetical protein V4448_00395 [Pseudomonadota bacterium]